MPGFVQVQFATARKPERCQESEALVGNLPRELDALVRELMNRGADVVAHQVQLVALVEVGWMRSVLGGEQREDQPTTASVDRTKIKHVAEEGTVCLRITSEDDGVNPGDHLGESDRLRGPGARERLASNERR